MNVSEEKIKKDSLELRNEIFNSLPLGLLIFNAEFKVMSTNENFFKIPVIITEKESDISGKSLFELNFVKEFNLAADLQHINEIPIEKELKSWETKNGRFSIVLKTVPIFKEEKFDGGLIILEDLRLSAASVPPKVNFEELLMPFTGKFDAAVYLNEKGKISSLVKKKGENHFIKSSAVNFSDVLGKSVRQQLNNLFLSIENSKSAKVEQLSLKTGGDEITVEVILLPFVREGRKEYLAFISDVSEKESEERALHKELEELTRFQQVSETLIDGLFVTDFQGKIKFWNPGAEKIIGLRKSQVFDKFISKAIPQFDENLFENAKMQILKTGTWESEFTILKEEKSEPVQLKMGLLKYDGKEEIAVLITLIGKQAEVEKELRSSEALYRNIVTHSNEYICILDTEGKITFANSALRNALEINEEEILGQNLFDFVPTNEKRKRKSELSKLLAKKSTSVEIPFVSKTGNEFYVLAKIDPIFDFNNELTYYNVILVDITARKESERDIQLIRTVFEASIDGISVIKNRKIILANDAFANMFDRKNIGEVIGSDPLDFCDPSEISIVAKAIQKSEKDQSQSQRFEYKGLTKRDKIIYIENSLSSFAVGEDVFIVSIIRDVTEKKLAREKLEQSEKQYRHIVSNINDFLWRAERIDGKLRQVFYTNAVEKILGYSGEEFVSNRYLWRKIIHPADREKVLAELKSIYGNKEIANAEIEYRAVNKFGNILWLKNKLSIIRDSKGKILEIVGLVSDVTLSRKAEEELKRSAEELRALNETKDRFLSIISHDLRTPFSSILGYTDLLLNNREMPEEKRVEYVSFIQESAKNMLSLVNSLLDWTRLQTGRIKFEPKRINAKVLINNSIGMLNGTAMQKSINLVSNVDMEAYVHADENLLLQVFNNLISNAIKFTKPGGSIEVSARPVDDKNVIEFCVADSGTGIKPEDMDKLFKVDSKFTLEGTAGEKGSGLGLSLVHDIVKKHNGEIWVKSKYGKGSRFYFTIPVSSASILVVDDIQTDRILYTKLLSSILPNFTFKNAPNGKVAFEAVKSSPPAMVITEHEMPLMNGLEFVKQIVLNDEITSKPPVIVLARKISEKARKDYLDLGVKYVFEKPVELDKFKKAIENALKERFEP